MGKRTNTWTLVLKFGILLGLALIVGGFIARDIQARAFAETDRLSRILWTAGAALAFICAVLDYRFYLGMLRSRRTAEGFNFAAVVLLSLALAGLLCYITSRRYLRMDWTGKRKYQLYSKTANILRNLPVDVQATVLYSTVGLPQEVNEILGWVNMTVDMMEEFRALSPNFTFTELNTSNPEAQDRIQEIVRQAGEDVPGVGVVFIAADSSQSVPYAQTLQIDPRTGTADYTGEDAFASALMKLTEEQQVVLYSLTGHGERSLEGSVSAGGRPGGALESGPQFSLSRLVGALEKDNYEVKPLNLQAAGSVPDDCAVLLIAGPRAPLLEAEIAAIRSYLDQRDGDLIVMLEPEVLPEYDSNLEELLAPYGLEARTDAVGISEGIDFFGQTRTQAVVPVYEEGMASHPATADLQNYRVWMEQACPIQVERPEPRPLLKAQPLLTGIESSWGEVDIRADQENVVEYNPDRDVSRPCVVGAVVQPGAPSEMPPMGPEEDIPGPKIVALGSSLSFTNVVIETQPGNRYLVQNVVNWMAGRMHLLGIPPKTIEQEDVAITESQLATARYLVIGIVPGCMIALGVVVWMMRRR